jgi:hypothetical protein
MATQSRGHATRTIRRRRWPRVVALLAILGVVVIGHGCHGEHVDDELSAVQKPRAGERSP